MSPEVPKDSQPQGPKVESEMDTIDPGILLTEMGGGASCFSGFALT